MKFYFPPSLRPINFFQVHGTMCCPAMHERYQRKAIVNNFLCYEAKIVSEANLLMIWGSVSKKFAGLLKNHIENLCGKRCIIHMRGCRHQVDNSESVADLESILPISAVFDGCLMTNSEYKILITKARQCLQA